SERKLRFRRRGKVVNVNRLRIDDRPAGDRFATKRQTFGYPLEGAEMRGKAKVLAIDTIDQGIATVTQSRRVLGHRIQHGLTIRRRAANDTEDLTRRGLLLQRLLEFVEQPHILDGDNRLVCERLKKFDLRRGEGAHLDATRAQQPNEFPLLTKGHE